MQVLIKINDYITVMKNKNYASLHVTNIATLDKQIDTKLQNNTMWYIYTLYIIIAFYLILYRTL